MSQQMANINRSTNSRLSSSERRKRVVPFSYQMFGMALNVASKINNEWAASILGNLWFRVFKTKQQPWITEFWQQSDHCIDVQLEGKSIPVYLWGDGPLVVMMHGWSGSGVQFRKLVPGLVKAGYRVASFDAPAHGANPGKHSHLLEFVESLLAIQQQIGEMYTLMAHSLGGMAAVSATQRGLDVQQMVLFAPHLDVDEMHKSYSEVLNLNSRLSDRFRDKIGQRMAGILGVEEVWTIFTPESLLKDSRFRGVLIYDADDEEIPQAQFKAVALHWQGSEVIETEGLGHNRILKDDKVINKVLAFMRQGV